MAEKVIGLRLQINGVPQTITNIKQLETEIGNLEGKLKSTAIGSAEFSNLSNEIRTARGQLEDFNKSTEGFGFDKLVESVGKFSAGVTGAFAAAGAAAQLFGKDSEDVNKAAQKAQNLLTLAVGATTIAEGVLAAKKLFTTSATVAQTTAKVSNTVATVGQTTATVALTGAEVGATAATGGLTVAIKALGTAIKSNPIGFIVGLLAAAAAAMYVFSDDTDDATAAIERLDAALKKNLQTIDETTRRTQNDLKIKLAAAEAEGASIEELSNLRQKSYTLEINAQAERIRAINDAYDKERAILEKGLSEKEKLQEGHQKKLRELDEKYGSQRQSAIVAKNNAEVNAEIDKNNTLKEIRDREQNAELANQKRRSQLLTSGLQQALTDLKIAYKEEIKIAKQKNEDISLVEKVYNKNRLEIIKQFNLAYKKSVNDLYVELNDLSQGSFLLEEKFLIESQKNRKEIFVKSQTDNNITVTKQLLKTLNIQQEARKTYETNITKLIASEEDLRAKMSITKLETENETKQQIFEDYLKQGFAVYQNQVFDKWGHLIKDAGTIQEEISEKTNEKLKVSNEKFANDIANIKIQKETELAKKQEILDKNKVGKATKLQIEAGQARLDLEVLFENQRQDLKLRKELEGIQTNLQMTEKGNADTLQLQKDLYQKDFELKVKNDIKKIRAGAEVSAILSGETDSNKIKKAGDDAVAAYLKLAEAIKIAGLAAIDTNNEINKDLINTEEEYLKKVAELKSQNNKPSDNPKEKELKDNDKLNDKLILLELQHQKDILQIKRDASARNKEIIDNDPTASPEAKQKANIELLTLENQLSDAKTAITKKEREINDKATKEFLQNLSIGIQEFSNTLNQVASLVQQSFGLRLQRLEADYQISLQKIADEEKRFANESDEQFEQRQKQILAKREETEKIYLANKKKIEKDAQIASLQFTLAQAIASGAQAFVNALASLPPPANAIVAGIQAGLTAIQVGIIGQQLSVVKSTPLARGGFLRGPSHEQGGIKYQGGSVELEGNEAVINRRSTLQYAPLLSQINQQGGGKPIYVNSIMDSRMAEVLASTKNEPIRAYVLEQDITKSQAVNRRLEELASY